MTDTTSTNSGKAPRRRKMPRAEREEQMISVANRVFGERGYHTASMDEIAEGVGVTKPMLYAYFGSKEGLYLATVQRAGELLLSNLVTAGTAVEPRERLRAGGLAFFRFVAANREQWTLVYREMNAQGGPVAERIGDLRARIAGVIASYLREVAQGADPGIEDPDAVAIALVGAGESLANWWVDHPQLPPEAMLDRFVAVTWTGLERFVTPGDPFVTPG